MRNQKYALLAVITALTSACGGSGSDAKLVDIVKKAKQETPKKNVPSPPPVPAPALEAKAIATGTNSIGQIIILDGLESQIYDGVTPQWQWLERPQGSQAKLINATSLRAQFMVDKAGNYKAQLTLTDSDGNTSSTEASITIEAPNKNTLPRASFQLANASVLINQSLELDGTASSDADGDTLSYLWKVSYSTDNAMFSLQNHLSAKANFSAQAAGMYNISLTVNDGQAHHTLSRTLQVVDANHTPTLTRIEQTHNEVYPNESVYFTAYAEDLDSDPISYQWRIVSRPANSSAIIQNEYTKQAYIVFDEIGEYVVEAVVSDDLSHSEAKRAYVKVIARPTIPSKNKAPYLGAINISANPKPNQPITLTVKGDDPDGDPITYRWVMQTPAKGSTYSFSNTTEAEVELTVDKAGWYLLHVYASDGQLESAFPSTTIVVVK
ncbi:PKD domain-containing protein [Pseudoalteromonas sp. JBTF-M23]|uniref:PKD domain-containing protein n=1 Tax=Pseudoalteromonas caenipelagi TaxID=2726988 RepID=A0A849VDB7_9GAMM|nr:PKD domain-containing protein [Pseudoalteromonas caenipelagi]NOU51296.1 PKD domain-containing protein [Pseudoalteromonas caenipelagi]